MPRDVNGNVSLPTNDSSPAVPRNVIRSSDFNELMGDISTMMQDSLSRSGKGGMTADLDMDGNDVLNAPLIDTAISKSNDSFARLQNTNFVYTINQMAALDVTKSDDAYLALDGRAGGFLRRLVSSLTTEEAAARTADTVNAIFVTSTNDAAHVWVRQFGTEIHTEWGGVVADATTDCATAMQAMINIASAFAPTFAGALTLRVQRGIIRADGLKYAPSTQRAFTMLGYGKDTTVIRRRVSATTSDVLTIGDDPSPAWQYLVTVGCMTIDGYDSTARGLVVNELYQGTFPELKVTNTTKGLVLRSCAYIDIYSPDLRANDYGLFIERATTPIFAGARPAEINIFGGVLGFNRKRGLEGDYVNALQLIGVGIEQNGTTPGAADEGGIGLGANCNRGSVITTTLVMRGGWSEDNKGIADIEVQSGMNMVEDVWFHAGVVAPSTEMTTYLFRSVAGRFVLRNLATNNTTKAAHIKEESGTSFGSLVDNCPTLNKSITQSKTATDDGPSLTRMFQTLGGSTTTGAALVFQNTSTFWELSQSTNDFLLKNGVTERLRMDGNGKLAVGLLRLNSLPTYASNAAAITGGLTVRDVYQTATGEVRIVV